MNCLVTNALYSHTGRQVLIPAGARILGETKPVQAFGETRLAVSFHRAADARRPHLSSRPVPGTQPDRRCRAARPGESALLSTFGAAAAVGLISGLSQYLGSAGLSNGRRQPDGRHRRRRRRCDGAGHAPGDEPISQPAADDHDPRRTPREGVSHQRYRVAGLRGARSAESVLNRRTLCSRRTPLHRCAVQPHRLPAHAQFVVIDPANLVQTTLIAYRMQQHYAELRARVPDRPPHGAGPWQPGPLPYSRDSRQLARPDAAGTSAGRGFRRSTAAIPPDAAYLSTALPLLRPDAPRRPTLTRRCATDAASGSTPRSRSPTPSP